MADGRSTSDEGAQGGRPPVRGILRVFHGVDMSRGAGVADLVARDYRGDSGLARGDLQDSAFR